MTRARFIFFPQPGHSGKNPERLPAILPSSHNLVRMTLTGITIFLPPVWTCGLLPHSRKMEFRLIFGNVRNRTAWSVIRGVQRGATSLPPKRLIERGFDMKLAPLIVLLLLATSPVAAQTTGTSSSQLCTEDPTYCSDTGATPSTTTGSGTSGSASSGGSGGGSSGGGAGTTPAIPNAPCGDGFPMDAWGECN